MNFSANRLTLLFFSCSTAIKAQREVTVGRRSFGLGAVKTKVTEAGGSSRLLRRAFWGSMFICWGSKIRIPFLFPARGLMARGERISLMAGRRILPLLP